MQIRDVWMIILYYSFVLISVVQQLFFPVSVFTIPLLIQIQDIWCVAGGERGGVRFINVGCLECLFDTDNGPLHKGWDEEKNRNMMGVY